MHLERRDQRVVVWPEAGYQPGSPCAGHFSCCKPAMFVVCMQGYHSAARAPGYLANSQVPSRRADQAWIWRSTYVARPW